MTMSPGSLPKWRDTKGQKIAATTSRIPKTSRSDRPGLTAVRYSKRLFS
jgi:hypothetical protein